MSAQSWNLIPGTQIWYRPSENLYYENAFDLNPKINGTHGTIWLNQENGAVQIGDVANVLLKNNQQAIEFLTAILKLYK